MKNTSTPRAPGTRITALSTALSSMVVAACGTADGGELSSTRDSTGVQIVQSRGPLWPAGKGWQITVEPLHLPPKTQDWRMPAA
jgi:hypothetical protein